MKLSNKSKGILCIIASAFFFALMSLFVRAAGENIPSVQKCFFRNIVAVFVSLIMILKEKPPISDIKNNIAPLFLRAAFGTLGLICNFYAIDHLVLSDASILNKLSPFFAMILSSFILKEKTGFKDWLFVIAAFAGSLFVIKPTFSNAALFPAIIGFIGGFGAGAAYTFVRFLGKRGVNKAIIIFTFSAFSCIVVLPWVIFDYHYMSAYQLISLLLAGVAASAGQFAITSAYTFAPAKEISVYDYFNVVFAALLGFIFFGQVPDIYSVAGYIIICTVAVVSFIIKKPKLS